MALQNTGELITSAQTLTASFAPLGSPIEVLGYTFYKVFPQININDSKGVEFRFKILNEIGGDEIIEPTVDVTREKIGGVVKFKTTVRANEIHAIPDDIDQTTIIQLRTGQNLALVQTEVRATTVGASAGEILTAKFRQDYIQ